MPTYLDLLVWGDRTEDDLCESLSGEHPEADPSNHTAIFNQSQSLVLPEVTQGTQSEEAKGRLMRHETWQLKVEESNRRSGKRKGSLWTYGSNTRRVMYSLGMRGSWWEKTFCRPTSHIRIFLLDFWERELPMTWNSMMPLLSSRRAVSSRAAFADNRLVWETSKQIIIHETRRLFRFINHKIQDVLIHNGRTSCYI